MIAGVIALLYDVHGNLPALDAVLEDAGGAGATGFLVGGDVALFGAHPVEAVERLRGLPHARWLRGNGERWTAAPDEAPDDPTVQGAIAAAREALGPDLVTELGGLYESLEVGGDARAWHGSPVSDVRSFLPEPAGDEGELLTGVREHRLIFGHTHLPFRRTSDAGAHPVELVNPGSVGMPFDGDHRAAYALLHPDDAIEHRRVAYDHHAYAAAVRRRGGDASWAQVVAARIERAAP